MELFLCSGDLGNLWQDQGASESKVGNQIGPNSTRWQNMNHSECEKDLCQVKLESVRLWPSATYNLPFATHNLPFAKILHVP